MSRLLSDVQLLRAYYQVRNDLVRRGVGNSNFVKMVDLIRSQAIARHTTMHGYVSWMLGRNASQPVAHCLDAFDKQLEAVTLPVSESRTKLVDVLGNMETESLPSLIVLAPQAGQIIELVL